MAERTWLQVDMWMHRQDDLAPFIPDYQRGPVTPPDAVAEAADLARRVGVRAAARQLGVSHAALLQAWRRRGWVVVGPGGRRKAA